MNPRRKTNILKTKSPTLLIALFVGIGITLSSVSYANPESGTVNANKTLVKRDPFWPINYIPRNMKDSTEVKPDGRTGTINWDGAMKAVVINGVSNRANNEYIAMINNKVKVVGDSVSISFGGMRYTWTVESIAPPGSVKLRRHTVK